MAYWRMQLHPDKPDQAIKHSIQCLAAGYIGLDFGQNVGDLMTINQDDLPTNKRDYWVFAHNIRINDLVLIIVHHFPFALATVVGEYNYIRSNAPEIGVWFKHFRKVNNVRYYADYIKNPLTWQKTIMTDTISPLPRRNSESYKLIKEWSETS